MLGRGVPGHSIRVCPGRAAVARVRASQCSCGTLCKWCSCRVAGVEECVSQEVMGWCARWYSSKSYGANMVQVWIVQGALCLCHFGKMALAVVSADQKYPSIHCTMAALIGCLGMMWARSPGLTEAVGQLGCLDCGPIHIIKVKGNVNSGTHQLLQFREISSSFSAIWWNSRAWVLYILVVLLNCGPFSCVSGDPGLVWPRAH